MAQSGALDTGYEVAALSMREPMVPVARAALNTTRLATQERQRIVIVGNAPPAPPPPSPPELPAPFVPPALPPTGSSTDVPPPSPAPLSPPPTPPAPPPAPLPPGTPLAGELVLDFNGEASGRGVNVGLAVAYALGHADGSAPELFEAVLADLSTTAVSIDDRPPVSVSVQAFLNQTANTVTLVADVTFHPHRLLSSPLNLGSLPLIGLDVGGLTGLQDASVTPLQKGAAPLNMTYPEQAVTLGVSATVLADLNGTLALRFDNATTGPLPPDASATAVRTALQELENVGEVEVFRTELRDTNGAFAGLRWTVRFYAAGSPPHIGAQPPLELDASGLSRTSAGGGRRQLSDLASLGITVTSVTTVVGESPFDPAEASDEAALETLVEDTPLPSNETDEAATLAFVPPVHVCGNGVRSTAEACDDKNTVGGDGCSALCTIEEGFDCISTTDVDGGSGVGGLDACTPICGDGKRFPWIATDQCDDNNTVSGDGCSASCTIEVGYQCSGGGPFAADSCAPVCGDGRRVGSEKCDDGNRLSLDGCDTGCAIEPGYTCSGGSSTSNDKCVRCADSCATCSGPLPTHCTSWYASGRSNPSPRRSSSIVSIPIASIPKDSTPSFRLRLRHSLSRA